MISEYRNKDKLHTEQQGHSTLAREPAPVLTSAQNHTEDLQVQ